MATNVSLFWCEKIEIHAVLTRTFDVLPSEVAEADCTPRHIDLGKIL